MLARFRKYFLSGLIVFLPLALTIYLLIFLDRFFHLKPLFEEKFGFYFPGLGILIGILVITVIGIFASNFFGRRLYQFFENVLLKLPFFKQVYPAIKEISLFLFSGERLKFKQVVLVQYPRAGIYSLGFLTNDTAAKDISEKIHKDMCHVFVPSAPGPFTGFLIIVPKKDVTHLDISVEQAIKLIVSGGVISSE